MLRLWSRIDVILGRTQSALQNLRILILLFLTRSGELPLDFCFYFFDDAPGSVVMIDRMEKVTNAFNLLVDNAHRWRNVQIRLPFKQHGAARFGYLNWPEDLPMLENLFMESLDYLNPEPLLITPNCQMPNLKVLHLKGLWLLNLEDDSSRTCESAFKHISPDLLIVDTDDLDWRVTEIASKSTAVRLQGMSWLESKRGTCRARRLEMFHGPKPATDVDIPFDKALRLITLPNVTELVFGRDSLQERSVRVPRPIFLDPDEFLVFKPFLFPWDSFIQTLSGRCNGAKITHFTIANYIISDANLLDVISHLPSLTFLAIDQRFPYVSDKDRIDDTNRRFALTKSFFRAVTLSAIANPTSIVIPMTALEELRLGFHPNSFDSTCSDGRLSFAECIMVLLDMVESRALGRERGLKKLWVHFESESSAALADEDDRGRRIQMLREDGLDFSIAWD
ncbi:hypothetical protein VKT23_018524 [Stygiomarasmius scandens]|uniref:F-box domain-containing protein n=1 Tax=Marasmiellus scandens TaxID=2682957 RepID=A0ABR1IT71_9AGAR